MARQKKPVHRVQMTEGKRNIIHQLLEEYDIQSAEDIQDALKDLLGGTIKEMMEAEMDDHLGYEKSERSDNDDYRNGYKTKQVNSRYGSMKIEVPQDRKSTFEPQVVKKHQKDISDIDQKLYIDAIHYSVRDNGVIRKLAAYVILGINTEGKKEVLTINIGDNESAKYWLSVMNELKNRGVKDVLIICADGLNAFFSVYIEGTSKLFTVRSLCNALKHNHALSFEELYEPYDFWLNINGQKINLRDEHIEVGFKQKIYEKDNPDIEVGEIKYDYTDDFSIDYEYAQGEIFRYEDCADEKYRFKIHDVYKECCEYFDALVELFEEVYNQIHPQISMLPTLVGENGKPNIKPSEDSISMHDYFTVV